ncbi:hypothetical protein [Thiothrix subterranea]|uniref:Uncharacterized protein n=1 Tax=Thiothrix subterranea TaxID=2735563 RepID=A0ABU0YC20_9GAMM|nr:hypothetical protein [Thiothrix subterranea]MDQ5770329.1 hypothetical protein [Thiothrix subterranea]QQZ28238.1 hypothetical protein HMY34_05420 [Thiothrix subterranea]
MADIAGTIALLNQSAQDSVQLMDAQTASQALTTQASVRNQAQRATLEVVNAAMSGHKSLIQALVQGISR